MILISTLPLFLSKIFTKNHVLVSLIRLCSTSLCKWSQEFRSFAKYYSLGLRTSESDLQLIKIVIPIRMFWQYESMTSSKAFGFSVTPKFFWQIQLN